MLTTVDRPRCDALTIHRGRCRREGCYPVVVDGRAVNLGGHHMVVRRQGQLTLASAAPTEHGATRRVPSRNWMSDESGWLSEHPEATVDEAAAHLGRSALAVETRRQKFRREGRG